MPLHQNMTLGEAEGIVALRKRGMRATFTNIYLLIQRLTSYRSSVVILLQSMRKRRHFSCDVAVNKKRLFCLV